MKRALASLWGAAAVLIGVGGVGLALLPRATPAPVIAPPPVAIPEALAPTAPEAGAALALAIHWERQPEALMTVHLKALDGATLSPTQLQVWAGGLVWWQPALSVGRYTLLAELTDRYPQPITVYGVVFHGRQSMQLPVTVVFTPRELVHLADLVIDPRGRATLFPPPSL